jgi:hypothetical protein
MWKRSVAMLPGIGVSLLPKLICPMCWPAYAGIVSALGLGFLISTTDVHFSCDDDGGTRISRITAARIRPSFARRDRSGDDFGRQVLF